jgi:hypothetical protein
MVQIGACRFDQIGLRVGVTNSRQQAQIMFELRVKERCFDQSGSIIQSIPSYALCIGSRAIPSFLNWLTAGSLYQESGRY